MLENETGQESALRTGRNLRKKYRKSSGKQARAKQNDSLKLGQNH